MAETELGLGDVALLKTLLGEELVLVETDTTDELEGALRGVTQNASLALDRAGEATLRDTEKDSALLLVSLGASRGDDHGEQALEVGVQDTLGDIVGVLERLGSAGEGEERGELEHAVERVPVIDRVLELLGPRGNLLLELDVEDGIARGTLEEDVRERAGHVW